MRSDITSSLSMKPVQVALELLVPLTLGGVIHGVLALNQQQSAPSPEADDLQTLQALAGMLASALADKNPDKAPLDHSGLDTLTAREQQVLALLPRGLTNAEMATELGVAAGTIKVHVERILFKLGLNDRTQAAVWASQRGLG
jgi:DNA-binding NarL/FixJ family response regulator